MPYSEPNLVNHLKNNLNGGESVIYYIHDNSDANIDAGFGSGDSLPHPSREEKYIEGVFSSIDSIIDLDFTRSYSFDGSDIDIYCLKSHSDWSHLTLGQAWQMGHGLNSWFDIGWKYTNNTNNDRNTIIHEIGHALGLGEPGFDHIRQPRQQVG